MKILITGADGMLGSSLTPLLKKNHTIIACTHKKSYSQFQYLDITNYKRVSEMIDRYEIDCIVHLASITNVDYCETHKSETLRVNYLATQHLVSLCMKKNIYFIYLSTGAVFSGKKKFPYRENNRRRPINIYGQSKLLSENVVQKYSLSCIVRTGWLIGGGKNDHKFVSFILNQIQQNKKNIFAVNNVFGSPTITDDLAITIEKLIEYKAVGLYHIVNNGVASRYDIALEIVRIMHAKQKVIPVKLGFFHEKANRPKMEALLGEKLHQKYHLKLPNWKESLHKYLYNL